MRVRVRILWDFIPRAHSDDPALPPRQIPNRQKILLNAQAQGSRTLRIVEGNSTVYARIV